jgi:hypothetical protein
VVKTIIVHDHDQLKKKCTICNSIIWFIFNVQKKNKQLKMQQEYIHEHRWFTKCNAFFLVFKEPAVHATVAINTILHPHDIVTYLSVLV